MRSAPSPPAWSARVATGFLKDNSRIKQDTVMGVVFSGMFGLGLVLYVKIQSDVHLDHILFGDMLGVCLARHRRGRDHRGRCDRHHRRQVEGLPAACLRSGAGASGRAAGQPAPALRPARADFADHRRRPAGRRHHPRHRHADRAGAIAFLLTRSFSTMLVARRQSSR